MPPISFAVQRPRQSLRGDSDSDSDSERHSKQGNVEFLSDFDASSSSKRKKGSANGAPSLVIASQPNKDWKKEAQLLRAGSRRKVKTYLPDEANGGAASKGPALTEAELAAADRITAQVVGGLSSQQQASRSGTATPTTELRGILAHTSLASPSPSISAAASPAAAPIPQEPETDDAKALRELLAGTGSQAARENEIDVIEQHAADSFKLGAKEETDEADTFRKDLDSRPDSSTLDDYARIPVEQFGAALLRGMGWGSSASEREARKPTEAIVPKARPALLGIGAKPLTLTEEAGSKAGNSRSAPKKSRREEMRFVPLMKKEVSASTMPTSAEDRALMPPPAVSRSGTSSRQHTDSPPSRSSRSDDKWRERDREYDSEDRRRDRDRDDRRSSKSSRRRSRSRSRSPDRRRNADDDSDSRRKRYKDEDSSRRERRRD